MPEYLDEDAYCSSCGYRQHPRYPRYPRHSPSCNRDAVRRKKKEDEHREAEKREALIIKRREEIQQLTVINTADEEDTAVLAYLPGPVVHDLLELMRYQAEYLDDGTHYLLNALLELVEVPNG